MEPRTFQADAKHFTSPRQLPTMQVTLKQLRDYPPQAKVLSNGRFSTMLTAAGSGFSEYRGKALTRWSADPTRDADGTLIYVRDLDEPQVWSLGYLPAPRQPERYLAKFQPGCVELQRRDGEIESILRVCVARDADVELRQCTLTNHGSQTRRLELTSYVEIVLNDAAADAAHPAFSKLFVQTGYDAARLAITAVRRPRCADEQPLVAVHFLSGAGLDGVKGLENETAVQWETDRARFLGRGRTTANPQALDLGARLSGTIGSVLDPVACLRCPLTLAPGETRQITFALGAGADRDEVGALIDRFQSADAVETAFACAADPEQNEHAQRLLHDSLDSQAISPDESIDRKNTLARFREYLPAQLQKEPVPAAWDEPLQFDNGLGGFSADGREYVLRLKPQASGLPALPPMPWTNVIANEEAGFLITASGGGYTWAGNSRENRLTPWYNDPISDPPAEAIFLRDEEAGIFWTPTPYPVPQNGYYEVRHGLGYTVHRHTSHELEQELIQFMPRHGPVKIARLRLRNTSNRGRRLSVFSYQRWVLGGLPQETAGHIETHCDTDHRAIFATNAQRDDFGESVAFSAMVPPAAATHVSHSADRTEFLGRLGSLSAPSALCRAESLQGRAGLGLDPCAAHQTTFELSAGESTELVILLGEAESQSAAEQLIGQYQQPEQVDLALRQARQFWVDLVSAVQIETPAPAINLMVNGWLPYQNLSCRIWGRSAFFQSGGAYGFRDQLQDAAAQVHHWPELTRKQILRNANAQFVEGDVLHWWHPPAGKGIRTRFADDLLWLPLAAAEYVQTTGDDALWNEQVQFLTAPQLADGEAENYLVPENSGEIGSLYEHCCRAIDRSLTQGAHGLPLMGCGDWNDGMNRIGADGRGESVWMGFFLVTVLDKILPICRHAGDEQRVARYAAYRDHLIATLNDTGWDGDWYRRAYFGDGTPLGTAAADECRIDALAQAWAILSGVASPERATKAIAAVEEHLVDENASLIRLLTPAFNKMPQDPGYIKGYVPGVRENGGQYTHGILWFIRAVAEMGQGSRAVELLEMISPVHHTRTAEAVATYQTEPYVIAADVYGEPPHVGRGGWSWYTGSAGWMFRVAMESILGIHLEGGHTLVIDPRIHADWSECLVHYRLPDGQTIYNVTIENLHGKGRVVTSLQLNGKSIPVERGKAHIPIQRDGKVHTVVVTL
jgi:N,N'-diacetylchitobiose phosphorylase